MEAVAAAGGAGLTRWQAAALSAVAGWVWAASFYDLTRRARALAQPWVTRRVLAETPAILRFQKLHHKLLDNFFSVLSCIVAVPFYTGFLSLLFWSGHSKLARQMTLLLAFCDYLGNSVKDIVSAPRPSSPPVRRVTATEDEKENAMEYGLPSSHALNTVCLMGYLLHYVLNYGAHGTFMIAAGVSLALLLVMLIGIGRIYLGMHSLIDVIAGTGFGIVILAFWLVVHDHVDTFVISGQNGLSLLMCFAYPKPEFPTPSFEYHAAFNGVAFGIVYGIQQTYFHFNTPDVPLIFSPQLPLLAFAGRVLVGIPIILVAKFCSKALSKWLLPVICSTLGIPIVSSCYVPALKANKNKNKSGYLQKVFFLFPQKAYDVDTGIRFVQYASLAWAVVDLVPAIFTHFNL
ncbi:lipid phosphate phosphatase delta-like isoform X2 [Phragmites australis]|uniref:lipid phosphate phosphatase delta-like isoform X2 n=1 Tax=Phragmites australis TaxID=29695 RepID=UPI002D787A64|nr:lipid phosphate phosphatase delta-like isoform X2 [Phragmites australis]